MSDPKLAQVGTAYMAASHTHTITVPCHPTVFIQPDRLERVLNHHLYQYHPPHPQVASRLKEPTPNPIWVLWVLWQLWLFLDCFVFNGPWRKTRGKTFKGWLHE